MKSTREIIRWIVADLGIDDGTVARVLKVPRVRIQEYLDGTVDMQVKSISRLLETLGLRLDVVGAEMTDAEHRAILMFLSENDRKEIRDKVDAWRSLA